MRKNGSRRTAEVSRRLVGAAHAEADAYRGEEDRPLGALAGIMATYAVSAAAGGLAIRRWGRLADRVAASDIALSVLATHKLSRLVTKDPVTSPLRAPFTRFEGAAGEAELAEDVRGEGARHALGELVACPFCMDLWVATALFFGLALAPRATRLGTAILASVALSDLLHLGYVRAQQQT